MKKIIITAFIPILILLLTACSSVDSYLNSLVPEADDSVPSRMIAAMKVDAFPEDPSMEAEFTDTSVLSGILQKLRNMDKDKVVEEDPHTNDNQSYFTVTVIYADGYEESYCLLINQYLQRPDGTWCMVTYDDVTDLAMFIRRSAEDLEEE